MIHHVWGLFTHPDQEWQESIPDREEYAGRQASEHPETGNRGEKCRYTDQYLHYKEEQKVPDRPAGIRWLYRICIVFQ